MERRAFESTAANVTHLRGLLAVPVGLLFLFTGVGNLGWEPFGHMWVAAAIILSLAAAAWRINGYYDDHYGRVTPSRKQQMLVSLIIFPAALVGGPLLDFAFDDLPLSLFTATFALAMLTWYATCMVLKAHHLVICGALLVAGLLPVWGSFPDRVSVAWLPIGAATIVAGILDHVALVRTAQPVTGLDLEDTHAGA